MMTYCFTNKRTGVTIERQFDMNNIPERVKYRGRVFGKNRRAEIKGVPPTKGWPIECIASGVHADQAQELRDHFKRNGLNIEVTKDGNPVYKTNKEQRRALRCRGMVNKSSFY